MARTWSPRPVHGNDRRCDDDDHLLRVDAQLAALEEPAEDGDAPQRRHLALRLAVVVRQDAADDQPLAISDDDFVLRAALEDRRIRRTRNDPREIRLIVL